MANSKKVLYTIFVCLAGIPKVFSSEIMDIANPSPVLYRKCCLEEEVAKYFKMHPYNIKQPFKLE